MTNPTPTTNEKIALELGWIRVETAYRWGYQNFYWKSPEGLWYRNPPDFLHDWAHAGPLWGEMVGAVGLLQTTNWISWKVLQEGRHPTDAELMLATCRAWLAWKEENTDG